jgi:hypothetical protein
MAIVVGIDEAGYGPTLGPLVVSAVAFRVPEIHAHTCLWNLFSESCTNAVRRGDRRLAIADSKRLYGSGARGNGLGLLERTALVMLHVGGQEPRSWWELLRSVSPAAVEALQEYAWYSRQDYALPLSPDLGDVALRTHAVRRDCLRNGVAFLGVRCAPLLEGHFNRRLGTTVNKSDVLLDLVVRLIHHLLNEETECRFRIGVDRLGGRTHYQEPIARLMPGWSLGIVEESAGRSAYRLTRNGRMCDLEFCTQGESRHMPIALASVFSKYLREIYMRAFNDFWSQRGRDLRPTAGYYTDARRWLRDARPILEELAVDRAQLVRER